MDLDIPTRELEGLLTLMFLPSVGAVKSLRLSKKFLTLQNILADPEWCQKNLKKSWKEPEIQKANEQAVKVLETADAQPGTRIIHYYDARYPRFLKLIHPSPPPILFFKGDLTDLERSVAVVGTRSPTDLAKRITRLITTQIVGKDWIIVSGLALGIDTIAHETAIHEKGRTIAVLPGSLDQITPKQNQVLADKILSNGGLLLTEEFFGTIPTKGHFIKRDRIQSGLSVAVFAIQSGIGGGTRHTIIDALIQERLLYVPPSPKTYGHSSDLEKDWANDVLPRLTGSELLNIFESNKLPRPQAFTKLMRSEYSDRPVAMEVSKDHYPIIFQNLEEKLEYLRGKASSGNL